MPKWGLHDLKMCSVSGSAYGLFVGLRKFVLHDADLRSLVSGIECDSQTLYELEGCSPEEKASWAGRK